MSSNIFSCLICRFPSLTSSKEPAKRPAIPVFTTEDGINRIKRFLNNLNDWKNINALYPENFMKSKDQKKTGIAGLFAGSLELVKEGNLQIKQEKIFDDIFIKKS